MNSTVNSPTHPLRESAHQPIGGHPRRCEHARGDMPYESRYDMRYDTRYHMRYDMSQIPRDDVPVATYGERNVQPVDCNNRTSRLDTRRLRGAVAAVLVSVGASTLAACSDREPEIRTAAQLNPESASRSAGTAFTVRDTMIASTIAASGVAEPIQQAALSSKLMGTVLQVSVREGDAVKAGQTLLRIDARDLAARTSQASASVADAEAQHSEATAHATRFRALYADSAATRAQFDAAQTMLARAEAGVRAARAAASEVEAMASYATVRAPFNGVVSVRAADPGMFAAPGVPLLTVQDVSSLRIRVTADANAVRSLKHGDQVRATIDGADTRATIEGIVSANAGNLFTVNAIVSNHSATFRAGSAATLFISTGTQSAVLVPASAIVREGDLTGVIVRGAQRDERRWIRIGASAGSLVEVTSGLHAGDVIVLPAPSGD